MCPICVMSALMSVTGAIAGGGAGLAAVGAVLWRRLTRKHRSMPAGHRAACCRGG